MYDGTDSWVQNVIHEIGTANAFVKVSGRIIFRKQKVLLVIVDCFGGLSLFARGENTGK